MVVVGRGYYLRSAFGMESIIDRQWFNWFTVPEEKGIHHMEVMTVKDILTGKYIKVLVDGPGYLIGDLLIHRDPYIEPSEWVYQDGRRSRATRDDLYYVWRKVVIIWK